MTSVLLIESGRAKVVVSSRSGKQVLLAVRGPGDVLGEFAALDGRPRSASVVALTMLRAWHVPADELMRHLLAEPRAALELLRLLVSRLREADLQRLDFGALDTTRRVAGTVLDLAARHGESGWLHLRQAEIGEAVGASREATVKALHRLRTAGLIETARGRLRVVRPGDLALVAAGRLPIP